MYSLESNNLQVTTSKSKLNKKNALRFQKIVFNDY